MENPKRVIVVDDEPITRIDLCQMLEELGFAVAGDAADGFDAIELCRAHRPDAVLMDIKMPVFDGLTSAETILQEDLAGCVVLLTAFSDRELIERATRAGVTGYLVKPVEERLLLPALEVAMAQSRSLRQARQDTRDALRQIEDQRLVERAKVLLARQKKISEAQAYRELQQLSMNKRCPLAEVAKALVHQYSDREMVNRAKAALIRGRGMSEPEAYQTVSKYARSRGVGLEEAARELLAQLERTGRERCDASAAV